MRVSRSLSGRGAYVHTDVEPVGGEHFVNAGLDPVDKQPARLLFALRERKITGHVPLRNYERMALGGGVFVYECGGLSRF